MLLKKRFLLINFNFMSKKDKIKDKKKAKFLKEQETKKIIQELAK